MTLHYLHGGGYVMGSAFGYRHLAGALALAAESGTLVPEYRLAPEHPFPAALEDALRAYLWMLDSGTDPGRVLLAGDSSGGGLILSLLLTLKEQELALPSGPVLFCPGVDLTFVNDAHRLAEHARTHGVDVLFELYPVPTHDFQIFWSFLPEAADALHQAGRFVRESSLTASRGRTASGEREPVAGDPRRR